MRILEPAQAVSNTQPTQHQAYPCTRSALPLSVCTPQMVLHGSLHEQQGEALSLSWEVQGIVRGSPASFCLYSGLFKALCAHRSTRWPGQLDRCWLLLVLSVLHSVSPVGPRAGFPG